MKVLVVEDSATLRAGLAQMLARMGHTVALAEDGERALEIIRADRPDIVLMDAVMPVLDGYETARRIRAMLPGDWVPIIFLSGSEDDQDLERGIEAGGDDYLVKPVSYVVLHAKIRAMHRIEEMRQTLLGLSAQLSAANRDLVLLARQDGLTHVANRRHFDAFLGQELRRAERTRDPLGLILCDVDYFKLFNDHYGHVAGDECLKRVAAALQAACRRPADFVARYGGEEFAMVLPNTGPDGVQSVAESMRVAVATLDIPHVASQATTHVSISSGGAVYLPGQGVTQERLVGRADEALYRAKSLGRNRCTVFSGPQDANAPA